jgi:hypothetical protein
MESTKRHWRLLGILGALFVPAAALAAVTIPFTFAPSTPIRASEVNANFAALKEAVDNLQNFPFDYLASPIANNARPTIGVGDLQLYVSSGAASFPGQNAVTINTGTRTGAYKVTYSLRYRVESGTNSFAFRIADTTIATAGMPLTEMEEHIHTNVQPGDRIHASGWFTLVMTTANRSLTLQVRAPGSTAARIAYDDARIDLMKIQP